MKTDLQCSRQQKPKLETLNVREPVDQSKDLRFIVSMNESNVSVSFQAIYYMFSSCIVCVCVKQYLLDSQITQYFFTFTWL